MRTSFQLKFCIDLQPGKYDSIDETIRDLLSKMDDKLTGEFNHTVANVIYSEWDMLVSPD